MKIPGLDTILSDMKEMNESLNDNLVAIRNSLDRLVEIQEAQLSHDRAMVRARAGI